MSIRRSESRREPSHDRLSKRPDRDMSVDRDKRRNRDRSEDRDRPRKNRDRR